MNTAVLDPTAGAELLADLGFLHVPGPPLSVGMAYLFVAVRRFPTLRHFDPERVDYWQTVGEHGQQASADLVNRPAPRSDYSWGLVRVVDRLAVSNEFVSFGGTLAAEYHGEDETLVFSSRAPILARGGHSQGWDPIAEDVAGWFARQRATAGQSAREAALNALTPTARYCTFVTDALSRDRAAQQRSGWRVESIDLLRAEEQRLTHHFAADWAAGQDFISG